MYRVRKSWEDEHSQIGAYDVLDNAIRNAKAADCKVYDEGGVQVWPTDTAETVTVPTIQITASQLSKGCKGDTVKALQGALIARGYDCGKYGADGDFGAGTDAAVRKLQADYGLSVDGIVGKDTWGTVMGMVPKAEDSGDVRWDEIKYFKASEFACKCGGKYCDGAPAVMRHKLLVVADRVREHFGAAAIVSSGLRCKAHNANEGGVSNSRHMYGKAMDFRVLGTSADTLLAYVKAQPEIRYAYKIDSNYVHMDVE